MIVALAGMFLVDIQAFRSMAIGSMSVVAVAVLAALTLLPAVLSLVGHWVDRLRVPLLRRRAGAEAGFWHRWAVTIMRRPWAFTAAALVLLVTLAVPFAAIRLGQPGAAILPADESPRRATERLAAEFGAGVTGPMEILVDTPGGAGTRANLDRVDRLTRALRADQAVAGVQSLTTVLPRADLDTYATLYTRGLDGIDPKLAPAVSGLANWDRGADLARITVVTREAPQSDAAESLVDRVRDRYVPAAGLTGQALVGGTTALNLDLAREISNQLPVVVLAVLALSFVLLAMAFRSLVLPLQAIAMNLLSVGAAYGLIVAVFQWGWGEQLLGFTSEGHIAVFVPLFLFSILFGLSMDYEVFLLSRIREEYLRYRGQRAGGGPWPREHGTHDHLGGAGDGHGVRGLRGRPAGPLQGDGPRPGRRRPDRRDAGPDDPGAGRDAPGRQVQLVDAADARPLAAGDRARGARIPPRPPARTASRLGSDPSPGRPVTRRAPGA